MIGGIVLQSSERYKFVDFAYPWSIENLAFIIPYPITSSKGNLTGIFDPWTYKVIS